MFSTWTVISVIDIFSLFAFEVTASNLLFVLSTSLIISASKPFLSFPYISISTLYFVFSASNQYTSILRFSSKNKFFTFTQSLRCTDTPLPFVIYPTISSPGTGLQHLDSFTKQLSIPFTIIPFLDGLFCTIFSFESSSSLSSRFSD